MATSRLTRVRRRSDSEEVLQIVNGGQDVRHQFQANITSEHSIDKQLAAFANGLGGKLLIGVCEDGKINGVSKKRERKFDSIIANAASRFIFPSIPYTIQKVRLSGRLIIVVTVPQGNHKPYVDGSGLIWQQVGNKRRIAHTEADLRSLLQSTDFMQADALRIPETDSNWIEKTELTRLVGNPRPTSTAADWMQLQKLGLVRAERLTLSGLLLLAKRPQFARPEFCLQAVHFGGNDVSSSNFLGSENYEGRLAQQLSGTFAFLRRNLRQVQTQRSFNSPGGLEIPEDVLEELLCNALLHRDYHIIAPTRLLLFGDRLEIVSPGRLGGGLTVENICSGATFTRNPLLTSFAKGLLPYRGLGTGIRRVLKCCPDAKFINDPETMLFSVILPRTAGR